MMCVCVQLTLVLSKAVDFWARLIMEAIEIHLDICTFNRNIGLHLSAARKPAL